MGELFYRPMNRVVHAHLKAIMALPQPSAFLALVRGFVGACPCCQRRFTDAK